MLKIPLILALAVLLLLIMASPTGYNPLSLVSTPTSTPRDKNVSLIFTGDVMLGRDVTIQSLDKLKDAKYPFLKVADKLREADLTFINLENPIIRNCPRHDSGFKFCAPLEMLEGLKHSGVDVITLANNHTLNYGQAGFDETISHLSESGFGVTGNNNLIERNIEGTRFGFLGFEKSQQVNLRLTSAEVELIKESEKKVDVLIIAMHWGVEYKDVALPGVKTLARELVNLGADAIIGSHPHWVQDYEHINGIPVYYSLGNFVFDQMWSENTKKGLVVELVFENGKVVKENLYPIYMREWAQPEWVE